jgi:hypothetical protein
MSWRPLLMSIAALMFAGATLYVEGPGLMRDVSLRNAPLVPARDLSVEKAECTRTWFIMSRCSIDYVAPQTRARGSINFAVFGSVGGERFQLMRAPDNRTVTIDLAVAKLINRITMLTFLIGMFALIFFFSFRKAVEA